jgi:hypothetical protein
MGRRSRAIAERRRHSAEIQQHYESPPPKRYPAQPLVSEGLTAAERSVAQLCRCIFHDLWTYPNVFRAERQRGGNVISKEVCDLLVVFGDHVIVFSDKDCVFPTSNNPGLDWRRWYRRAVEKSAEQLFGAERVLRDSRETVFLDAHLKTPLPLTLPSANEMKLHRVLVAHGACQRCRQSLGGSGTLMIQPEIIGDAHMKPPAEDGVPFAIGQVNPAKGYVHVLDDAALALLFRVLDTPSDLVRYFEKKERFITSGRLKYAAGEEALLGEYVGALNSAQEHDFVRGTETEPLMLDEGRWHRFAVSAEARSKLEADRPSYLWDETLASFVRNFRAGTSHHLGDLEVSSMETVLRFFLREDRLRRRLLSNTLRDMVATTKFDMRRLRVIPPMRSGDPYWVFLLLPFLPWMSYNNYRDVRLKFLEICCTVVRLENADAKDIVGFATETGRRHRGSEDAVYMDGRVWNDALAAQARKDQRKLSILTSGRLVHVSDREYPVEFSS